MGVDPIFGLVFPVALAVALGLALYLLFGGR